jgi:nitrogen fixation/metabolism regulation signal transduction histidine kinase
MHRLRNRLILAFLAATVLPLAATAWLMTSLLDGSLSYATTGELDRLSRTLEGAGRQFYQLERDTLKQDALAGRVTPALYAEADAAAWPADIRAFWDSADGERFMVSGTNGDRIDWLRRRSDAAGVERFTRDLRGVRMEELSAAFRRTRDTIDAIESRDLRRGFTLTMLLLIAAVWMVSLVPLIFIAHRVSQPIQSLTAGLSAFAAGEWSTRLETTRADEVGRAVHAFNDMAEQLRQSRDRLVHLTQAASWQSLARKTAHEVKNSLTPIRLTIEEMLARQPAGVDRVFMEQAVQIVVNEIETLERRVRAFSEFASEPPIEPTRLDLAALVAERVSLLRPAHPGVTFDIDVASPPPVAYASADLVKGIVTNLLQNAAEAAGEPGRVVTRLRHAAEQAVIEVHDSGPGLSMESASTLFAPTITFKKQGMGLGLSIARRHAVLSGGDVALIDGELGGAAFRVTLPATEPGTRNQNPEP